MQVQLSILLGYFYSFINGFYMMKQIPIMWNVIKMCIIVFGGVATTFIIAYIFHGQITFTIRIDSFDVIYFGSLISLVILIYYSIRIGLIYKRNRQLKQTK